MVHRDEELDLLQGLLKRHRVVGILGARQVGKTTLAGSLAARLKQPVTYFDLESPADQARLAEPLLAHAGAELDLLVVRGGVRLGFEVKRTMAPKVTPSMRTALADLRLKRLDMIHAGNETFPLPKQIRAVALSRVITDLSPLA